MLSQPDLSAILAIGSDMDTLGGQITFGAYGDVAQVAGIALVQKRLFRRAIAVVGTVLDNPSVGANLVLQVDSPLDDQSLSALAQALALDLAQDPAVLSIDDVVLDLSLQATLGVAVKATLVGNINVTIPLVIRTGSR